MMVQSAKKSYNLHLWYEKVLSDGNSAETTGKGYLQDGLMDKES